jgi:hypothetical protein
MVPHERQQKLSAFGAFRERRTASRDRRCSGRAKGEALVLLSAVDIDLADLRKKLRKPASELVDSKHVQRVEAIPI